MSSKPENLLQAKDVKTLDINDVEMVIQPKSPKTGIRPDIHMIANEKSPTLPKNGILSPESDVTQSSQPLLEPDRRKPTPPLAGKKALSIEPHYSLLHRTTRRRQKFHPFIVDTLKGGSKRFDSSLEGVDVELPPSASGMPGAFIQQLGPEIDDLDDEKPMDAVPFPGIDDGLLDIPTKPDITVNGVGTKPEEEDRHSTREDGVTTDDGKWWTEPDAVDGPYDGVNGFGPRFGLDDRPGSPMIPGSIPDVNTYQQKKNLAQGMMDLALLSANANQLRYVLESSQAHPYYYPSLVFISLSIIFQIAVGVGLIMNSRYNVKDDKDICKADKINNMTVLGIFLITIVNVFITSFSVATPNFSPPNV